uniref:Neur_chan_LBD domain-containing protein n=1 Tax=Heligmosomoides polygyrus TaxID=6339 RepID=A0A183FXB8_HELPZ
LTPFLHLITYICFIIDQYIYPNTFVEVAIFLPLSKLEDNGGSLNTSTGPLVLKLEVET